MAFWILAVLIGVPLVEIMLFIEIGGAIGLWPTIATVIGTAVIGTALLRRQGLAVLASAQRELDQQRLPVQELFSGVCLVIAGILLLTPGFLTDALGFALLIPPLRSLFGRFALNALQNAKGVHFSAAGFRTGPESPGPGRGGPVVDVEAIEVDETGDTPPGDRH